MKKTSPGAIFATQQTQAVQLQDTSMHAGARKTSPDGEADQTANTPLGRVDTSLHMNNVNGLNTPRAQVSARPTVLSQLAQRVRPKVVEEGNDLAVENLKTE